MKSTLHRLKLSLILAFAVIMIASSFEAIYTNAASNTQESSKYALPDFLLRLSEYQANGNATQLERIRNQMLEQEKIKQDRIVETKGAVLNLVLPEKARLLLDWPPIYSYLSTVEDDWTSPDESYGYIDNEHNLEGTADNNYAHLHTDDWNHVYDPDYVMGGEAFAAGYMYGGWASGDFYVHAKRGPHWQSGWQNYVILYTTDDLNTPFGEWNYLGYGSANSSSAIDVYIGTSFSSWECLAVMVWTPPPYPNYYEPLICNCVDIDCVISDNWY